MGEHELIVKIDPEATNNFISTRVVQRLGISCEDCDKFGVLLGNGDEVVGKGICKNVKLVIQGLTLIQDFISLDLGNSDLILGVQWLETLGPVTTNWKTHTMKFEWQGQRVILIGDPSLKRSKISLKAMLKVLRKEDGGILVEFNGIEHCVLEARVPAELQDLFATYTDLFLQQLPLPPHRVHDHAITLKEGIDPINVRPYRYPHSQKNEIERLVQDMLKAGIIQPSVSPFSSPVILFKKKGGSWRFCVEDRARFPTNILFR